MEHAKNDTQGKTTKHNIIKDKIQQNNKKDNKLLSHKTSVLIRTRLRALVRNLEPPDAQEVLLKLICSELQKSTVKQVGAPLGHRLFR